MSRSVTDPRLCFNAEHFDTLAGRVRTFQLLFFYNDQTIELTDLGTKKCFLKRCECKNLTRSMFFIGAEIVVFGRLMKLVSYGDGLTTQLCAARDHKILCILGESHLAKFGDSITTIQVECGFTVRQMVTASISAADLAQFGVPSSFAGREVIVLVLVRENAAEKGAELCRRLGRDCWCSATDDEAAASVGLYDIAKKNTTAALGTVDGSSTIVVIKNHVITSGDAGDVIKRFIAAGLAVNAVAQVTLSGHEADAFVNVYKGILEDYRAVVDDLSAGATWVVQFVAGARLNRDDGATVVDVAREVSGPFDPVIAKALRPKSLRALYGRDRVHNAVHCSDLPADSADNAVFFFLEIVPK